MPVLHNASHASNNILENTPTVLHNLGVISKSRLHAGLFSSLDVANSTEKHTDESISPRLTFFHLCKVHSDTYNALEAVQEGNKETLGSYFRESSEMSIWCVRESTLQLVIESQKEGSANEYFYMWEKFGDLIIENFLESFDWIFSTMFQPASRKERYYVWFFSTQIFLLSWTVLRKIKLISR